MNLFNKIQGMALNKCKKINRPDLSDDFCQFVVEAQLRNRKANNEQLFIDFMRMEFGNSNKQNNKFYFGQSVQWEDYMEESAEDSHNLDFMEMVNEFEGIDRSSLILYYIYGMTMKEIGEEVGLTESAISLRMKDINSRLVKRYGNA